MSPGVQAFREKEREVFEKSGFKAEWVHVSTKNGAQCTGTNNGTMNRKVTNSRYERLHVCCVECGECVDIQKLLIEKGMTKMAEELKEAYDIAVKGNGEPKTKKDKANKTTVCEGMTDVTTSEVMEAILSQNEKLEEKVSVLERANAELAAMLKDVQDELKEMKQQTAALGMTVEGIVKGAKASEEGQATAQAQGQWVGPKLSEKLKTKIIQQEQRDMRQARVLLGQTSAPKISKVVVRLNGAKTIQAQEPKERRKVLLGKAKQVAETAKVGGIVKEVSLIGESLAEFYVEQSKEKTFRAGIMSCVDEQFNPFVSQEDMRNFQNGKIKDTTELKKRIESRLTFLAARNPAKNMRDCILEGLEGEQKITIIKNADELRATWLAKKTVAEEPKTNNEPSQA